MGGRSHNCPVCALAGWDCACYAAKEPETRCEEYDMGVAEMRKELAEYRAGKRRVFWRVYDDMGNPDHLNPHATRAIAFDHKYAGGSVHRVTVGPAKPKEAK